MNVSMVTVVDGGVDVAFPGAVLHLCVAIFLVAFGIKSIKAPLGVHGP